MNSSNRKSPFDLRINSKMKPGDFIATSGQILLPPIRFSIKFTPYSQTFVDLVKFFFGIGWFHKRSNRCISIQIFVTRTSSIRGFHVRRWRDQYRSLFQVGKMYHRLIFLRTKIHHFNGDYSNIIDQCKVNLKINTHLSQYDEKVFTSGCWWMSCGIFSKINFVFWSTSRTRTRYVSKSTSRRIWIRFDRNSCEISISTMNSSKPM